ncbi:twin transmembrane helix small protein [Pseudosulfitobacter koreensis]|uniref:Twin transmembrane helix small protein n=1 Tax=Pseudosulfitobacter koreensis TaxID=2968472 RepID=A0ABT1YVJ7_9RHOB|nr:twin transmembrane helix small protein [Pseudosulfitobacter koreense]MCR8824920.1 twin transmembrane helix small protein [Pseudosulfitobacter koreense]
MTSDPMFILILLACAAVVLVLVTGLGGFAKGDGWASKNSNKLMRMRIMAQFAAVVLIVIAILWRQSGG